MKEYCIVRRGLPVLDEEGTNWEPIVHRCPQRDNVQSYRVCLHSDQFTVLIEHFDVHCGRYDSPQEETRVALSAVGHACSVAAHLEKLHPYQLRAHLRKAKG